MQGILYLTKVPKFGVVAPTNNANRIENKKQNKTAGSLIIVRKKNLIPTLKRVEKVSIKTARLSKAESSCDAFLTSHINGLNNVATIAAGAIFIKLPGEPSNSTPKEN